MMQIFIKVLVIELNEFILYKNSSQLQYYDVL